MLMQVNLVYLSAQCVLVFRPIVYNCRLMFVDKVENMIARANALKLHRTFQYFWGFLIKNTERNQKKGNTEILRTVVDKSFNSIVRIFSNANCNVHSFRLLRRFGFHFCIAAYLSPNSSCTKKVRNGHNITRS